MKIEFNSSGGTSNVTYAINCDGEVRFTSSDNSWLHIEFGNGILSISADTYNEQSDRTGTITPSVNGVDCPNKVINVTQKKGSQPEPPTPDCTRYEYAASFPGETLELEACATSVILDVTGTRKCVSPDSGEPIDYTPKVSWSKTGDSNITISSTEGTAITVSATDNCVTSARDAVIGITAYTQDNDAIGSTTISVTQNGGCDCEEPDTCGCESITVTPIENNLSYTSGNNVTLASADVGVDCINRFSFTSDSNFISNIRISNGNVVGNITENSSENDRTATITVKFDTNSACTTFTITQEGRDEPEEHNPFFKVDFIHLNGGSWSYDELRNNGGINDGAPFIVSSSTWNGSSYQWANVTITIDDADYAQYITFDSGTPISGNDAAKTFRMFFKDSMPNKTKNGIHVTVKQNSTDLSSGATFNVRHVDDILYNDIRPYVVRISYEKPSTQSPLGVPERYGYYLHFKSYGDTNPFNGNYTTNEPIAVNNKVTFFANDNNCFTTYIEGIDCAGRSCGHPQGLPNRPYLNANESDTLVYDTNPITYANNIKNGVFLRNATEACVGVDGKGFKYMYSETDIDFLGATSGSTIMQGYKSGESSVDSYYDGVRSVYLKIPNQVELDIVEGPHVLKASQVIFDDGDSGSVTVSVYEDGVAFVDSAQTSVATINECFQNITQFVNTVYPSGYNNEIQSCTMFNFVDLDGHCIKDIVIENGELVKRDDTTPSSTVAMHIELDEEPSDTQAMHIETDNN